MRLPIAKSTNAPGASHERMEVAAPAPRSFQSHSEYGSFNLKCATEPLLECEDTGPEQIARKLLVAHHLRTGHAVGLPWIWQEFVRQQHVLFDHFCTPHRDYVVLRTDTPPEKRAQGLHDRDLALLCRTLAGESQKSLALQFGLSPSSVTLRLARCRQRLGLSRTVDSPPLTLVLAAQAYLGAELSVQATSSQYSHRGRPLLLVCVTRPTLSFEDRLTPAEVDIANWIVRGKSLADIAERRNSSLHTVVNQLGSIRKKLGVSRRSELLRTLSTLHAPSS